MFTILFLIYLVGFFAVFCKLLSVGVDMQDKITLGDILLAAIISLGSWILIIADLSGRFADVVIWRKKYSDEDENIRV